MRFAVIVHPLDLEELRRNYPLVKRIPAGLLARFAHYLPPVKVGSLNTAAGDSGVIISCPLLPDHFTRLGPTYLEQKLRSCLRKAEKLGARVVGVEGWTAFLSEEENRRGNSDPAALTSGLRLQTWQLFNEARLLAKSKGLLWSEVQVVLAGAGGQEGRTWAELLARETKALTLLQSSIGNEQGFVNRIIYETGLALKASTQPRQTLKNADVVFLLGGRTELALDSSWFKSGAIVCPLIPGSHWEALLKERADLTLVPRIRLQLPTSLAWSEDYDLSGGVSVALAETIIMVLEKRNEWLGPGRDITIKQVEEMGSLALKYGLQSCLSRREKR